METPVIYLVLIHSFNKDLSAYSVQVTVLSTWNTSVNKVDRDPWPDVASLVRKSIKQISKVNDISKSYRIWKFSICMCGDNRGSSYKV